METENILDLNIKWCFEWLFEKQFQNFFFGYAACLWDGSSPISNWTQALPVEAWNPKHWTAREFPKNFLFN